MMPLWLTGEVGQRIQEQVWRDLLKTLESHGHSVDVETLIAAGK